MKIKYQVHTAAPYYHSGPVTAPIAPVVTVELVSEDPGQTNPTLHVPMDDPLAKAKAGDIVFGTFAIAAAAADEGKSA